MNRYGDPAALQGPSSRGAKGRTVATDEPQNITRPTCPVCRGRDARRAYQRQTYHYVKCEDCAHTWLHPLLSAGAAGRLYGSSYFCEAAHGGYLDYAGDEPHHRENARERLRLLSQFFTNSSGRVLDVGCALGYFVDEARRAGWNSEGVEISDWAADYARAAHRIPVFPSLSSALEPPGRYDAITFFQSLEHMTNPIEALRQAHEALRPQGVLMIESWDGGSLLARMLGNHWHQVSPPSVLHIFDRVGLDRMLKAAGFKTLFIRSTSKKVSLGFIAGLLREKYPSLFRKIIPPMGASRWGGIAVAYRFSDLVTAFAVRGARVLAKGMLALEGAMLL